tara:strand:- start:337 stop:963 length:627 start_codon:yes stop_codon:yes gene_type:complete
MKLKYWSWFLLFLVPFLGLAHLMVPNGEVWTIFNQSFQIAFYKDWATFIWQLSPVLVSAIVIVVLIFSLPRRTTPWQLIVALAQLLFLLIWNIERMVMALRYVNGHSYLVTVLVCTIIVGGVLLIWKRRQKTEREKKEALLQAIDQLTAEDLPALYTAYLDVELTASEMKETDFVWAWKEVLKRDIAQPKIITTTAIQKFLELKAANT